MQTENKMGILPVRSLLIRISLPIMVSVSIQSLYTVVDSMFVSRLGEQALTAATLALPVMMIIVALSNGLAVGTNALLSRFLGEKNGKQAEVCVKSALWLAFGVWVVVFAAAMLGSEAYLRSQTTDETIIAYGTGYLKICAGFSLGLIGQTIMERFLISTGKTMFSMMTQGTGAVLNIILDPILIWGYFGFPAMGINGAALATVIAQCTAFVFAIILNKKLNREIVVAVGRSERQVSAAILKIGIPASAIYIFTSLMFIVFNMILESFTITAVAVFGILRSVVSFFFMLANGLCSGMVPVLAYNYGAGNRERVKACMRYGFLYISAVTLAGTLILACFPMQILGIFNANADMLAIGVVGIRIFTCSLFLGGLRMMSAVIMQSLGRAGRGVIISVTREFIVLIPIALLAAHLGNLPLVWASAPIADLVSASVGLILLYQVYRSTVKTMSPVSVRTETTADENSADQDRDAKTPA